MVRKLILLIFIAIGYIEVSAQTGSGVYSPQKIKDFAAHLYSHGYYYEAAGQYEWVWKENRTDTFAARMMLQSWRASSKYHQGFDKGIEVLNSGQQPPEAVLKEYIALSAWSSFYDQGIIAIYKHRLTAIDSLQHLINLNLLRRDFDRSSALLAFARNQGFSFTKQEEYQVRASELKYKKPWLAAGLSAVIPGSGKVYSGEWRDGTFSFCSIVLLGVQSYVGFRKDGWKSPLGIISGGLAISFYSANIYGSAKSARKFNQLTDSRFTDEALRTFYPAP